MPEPRSSSASRLSVVERLLVDPPHWAMTGHRCLLLALPVLVTVYGIWYDALAARVAPDLFQIVVFAAAGSTLWLGRRWPFVTVGLALACWSLTESCVFVIAVAYLLARWQPRFWWGLLGILAIVHPLGLVPDPCAYRAGHTALPPETAPVFAVALPALLGAIVLTSVRLAGVREERLRAEAVAADERARAVIATERLRLSEEMHDLLGQRVSRMVLHATAISATSADPSARELAGRIADTGASTVDDLQYIVAVLRQTPPDALVGTPDAPSAPAAVDEARRDGMTIDSHGLDSLGTLPEAVRTLAGAVVRETLHNAAKYAGGASVAVLADVRLSGLVLHIENGPGRRVGAIAPGGHGLARLRERAAALDGTLVSGPNDDAGFAVTLEVPL